MDYASVFKLQILSSKNFKSKISNIYFFIILSPHLVEYAQSSFHILLIQIFVVVFGFMGTPAIPIFYKHIPVFKRFTYASFMYALSRAVMYIITSFGMVYFSHLLGNFGVLMIFVPILFVYTYGLYHFEKLENNN